MRTTFIISFIAVLCAFGQKDSTSKKLDEVIVSATRTSANAGFAHTNLSEKTLKKVNLGQDLPVLLEQLPSVTVSSDAGAGIGYTGIRIRGTDPTRINVTINGVPQNDAESQGLYWVNTPDLASSVGSIQVQRGVGSSTNGGSAFGGTVNINTMRILDTAQATLNISYGSFNTSKLTLQLASGLKNGFDLQARVSKINSDGFIDRASSDLFSYHLEGGYRKKNSFSKLLIMHGKEKTYQAWEGVSEEMLKENRQFNPYTYANQTDNYWQTNYQWVSSIGLGQNWRLNPVLHYTKGKGYYEQLKEGKDLNEYAILTKNFGEGLGTADLVTQKWLDNDFMGMVYSLENTQGNGHFTLGGGYHYYLGDHYGEIIKVEKANTNISKTRYYQSASTKIELNNYVKYETSLKPGLNIYGDLQLRKIWYDAAGTTDKFQSQNIDYYTPFTFFNPKMGISKSLGSYWSGYASFAIGNKEPSRQDFVDNSPTWPKPERLYDTEVGVKFNKSGLSAQINLYDMNYKDQLVLTGAINAVGEAIRVNVARSYRKGLELIVQKNLNLININGNVTLSQNKILNFKETIVNYDGNPNLENQFNKTDISFSPAVVGSLQIDVKPVKSLEIGLSNKYVGRQYLDNTQSISKSLDSYMVQNLRITYQTFNNRLKDFSVNLLINNLFNTKYESNGYTYSYIYDKATSVNNFYYPQAGINYLLGVNFKF